MAGPQEEHQFHESLHTNHVTSVLRVPLQTTFVSVARTLVARVEWSHYTSVCRRGCWYCNNNNNNNNNNNYLLQLGFHPVAVVFNTYTRTWSCTTKFTSGGIHEKHVVATWTWEPSQHFALKTQGNQERKPASRWPVAGPSEHWHLASSPASKVKHINTHITTILNTQYTSNQYTTHYSVHQNLVHNTTNPITSATPTTNKQYINFLYDKHKLHKMLLHYITHFPSRHLHVHEKLLEINI